MGRKHELLDIGAEPRPRRNGYHKPTREELAERIAYTASLLGRSAYRHQVRRLLAARYGVGWRTADRYLAHARRLIRKSAGVNQETALGLSLAFWWGVIRSGAASLREKMLARARLDWLLGLRAPVSVRAISAAAGAEVSRERQRAAMRDPVARRLLGELEERLAALDVEQLPSAESAPPKVEPGRCRLARRTAG
jgi:hypothetical protein